MRPAAPRLRPFPEISVDPLRAAAVALAIALTPAVSGAATPSASPAARPAASHQAKPPARVDITKIQPKALLPKRAEHQEYLVEINKYGQVARVRSQRGNGDRTFNAQTYGNVLQAFIRTPDGHVVLGTYRLTYDFDPKTARVKRDVTLVSQGGVNPDAVGAVDDLLSKVHSHTPIPIDPRSLPDLNGATASPTASPTAP